MCLSLCAVGVSANSLSSDMHGQDLTVITLHCPAVPLFNFIGFYRYKIYQTSHGKILPQKILICRSACVVLGVQPPSAQFTVPSVSLSLP